MPSAIVTTIPVDAVASVKSEFRANFLAAKTELDHGGYVTDPTTSSEATATAALANIYAAAAVITAQGPIASLSMTVSNPPTQAEVQEIADKVDEIIEALVDAGVFI